ncbi:MAG: tetraacyldisaccharide 4'-kinase, partial [Gammaproteobacteria bacterium]
MLKKTYQRISIAFTQAWYQGAWYLYLLWPLSKIFEYIVTKRYQRAQKNLKPSHQRAPIVVVGNITVGGTGKTPCIIALAKFLRSKGFSPGVVSRGYGVQAPYYPYFLDINSTVKECGDEALLIYKELECPVVIDP